MISFEDKIYAILYVLIPLILLNISCVYRRESLKLWVFSNLAIFGLAMTFLGLIFVAIELYHPLLNPIPYFILFIISIWFVCPDEKNKHENLISRR